jgi:hypothetical protein
VEDKVHWLVFGGSLLLDILLMFVEELWVKLDVARLVDTVDVSETGGNGEEWADWAQGLVDSKGSEGSGLCLNLLVNVLWLSVEGSVVDILVVNTIFFTTSDADFHLEPDLHWGATLEVVGGGLDVPLNRLLGKINHWVVRRSCK